MAVHVDEEPKCKVLFSEKTNYAKYSVAHWADRNESEQAGSEREAREPVKGVGVGQ